MNILDANNFPPDMADKVDTVLNGFASDVDEDLLDEADVSASCGAAVKTLVKKTIKGLSRTLMDYYMSCVDDDGDATACSHATSTLKNFHDHLSDACAKSHQSCIVDAKADDGHEN